MAAEALHVDERVEGTAVVVRAVGEVDARSSPLLAQRITIAFTAVTPPGPLVLDLRAVTFLSSVGMAALIDAHQQANQLSFTLRLVAESALARRLAMVGLLNILTVCTTLTDALFEAALPNAVVTDSTKEMSRGTAAEIFPDGRQR